MVKAGRRFPSLLSVTLQAVCAEFILMGFLVAKSAFAPQTQERTIEVFHFDLGAGGDRDSDGIMAFLALLFAMLSFQSESRFGAVIETPAIQFDQLGFQSLVFFMTTRAIRLAQGALVRAPVLTSACLNSVLDFDVAIEAFEPFHSKVVAIAALGDAGQIRVSARQGAPGGYLPTCGAPGEKDHRRAGDRESHAPRHPP